MNRQRLVRLAVGFTLVALFLSVYAAEATSVPTATPGLPPPTALQLSQTPAVIPAAISSPAQQGSTGTLTVTQCLPSVLKNAGPPSAPVLDDIPNLDGDGNYTVSWSTVNGATSYTLEEDDNVTFSSPTTVQSGPATSSTIIGKDLGTYYYRVKASNSYGSSVWSNVRSVEVSVEPSGPEPGHYTGTNPGVSFDVTTAQEVCDFDITVPFEHTTCRIRLTTCLSIVDNEFVFAVLDPWFNHYENRIEGSFDTRTHAVGSYSIHFCETTLIFAPSEGTWEASK